MYSTKDRWTIESEMIYKSKNRLLEFDKLSAVYFKNMWMNLKQESLANHMFRKFPQYDYDPSFFFSSGCDPGTQSDIIYNFNFNMDYIEIIKVMNFFFWIKNSLGLGHFMTFFNNDEAINNKWIAWRENWAHPTSQNTISFFFEFSYEHQKILIEEFQKAKLY